MTTDAVKVANRLFKSGKYEEALIHYEKAAKIYGEGSFSANFQLCKKRIESARNGSSRQVHPILDPQHKKSLGEILLIELGVENVYIVNLKRRPDRYVRAIREMNENRVSCTRIEGVDAKYSIDAHRIFNAFKSKSFSDSRKSSGHISLQRLESYKSSLTAGVFGYLLSQKKVFEDAKRNGYKKILVCDDDVFWHSQASECIKKISNDLIGNFRILLLGASEYSDRDGPEFQSSLISGSEILYHPIADKTCGSFAVVYDESVFDEILEAIAEADGPFDNVALGSLYKSYKKDCFAVTPAVCIPNVNESDIRTSNRAQLSHSARMRWETSRYMEFTRDFKIGIIATSFESFKSTCALEVAPYFGINISLYYLSDDGLRPVTLGRAFTKRDANPKPIRWDIEGDFKSTIEHQMLPKFDIAISWPEEKEITGESVVKLISKILTRINKDQSSSGVCDSHFYSTYYKAKVDKGKHSIVIPCYRNIDESFATIKSALVQDAKNFEVIVVNDNPENEFFERRLRQKLADWEIVKNDKRILSRLIVIEHKRNRNASAARNTGMMHSTGQWITFLDDDDYFEPNRLSAVEHSLQISDESYGACYCGYSGNWNGNLDMNRFPEGDLWDKVVALKYSEHYMCTNTITFKRSALVAIGGFDESYTRHQDLELMARFFRRFKIKSVKLFLVKNRPQPVTSTFNANTLELAKIKLKFLEDIGKSLAEHNLELSNMILDAHTKDIFKGQKNVPQSEIEIVRSMLEVVLLKKSCA